MRNYILMLLAFICLGVKAQVITTSPGLLQETSENVVLTFHADRTNVDALKNLPASTPLYTHIGVITDKSNGEWVYVVTDWNTSNDANKLTYTAPNTYTFTIGNIRSFFKITDPEEHVTKIAFIARTATPATNVTQTPDMFIDVLEPGFRIAIDSDAQSTVLSKPTDVTFTVNTTDNANITLAVNGTQIASATSAKTLSKTHRFENRGFYEVTATATHNGQTYTTSYRIAYPSPSTAEAYPGGTPRMGAVKNSDGSVTFCLAAPGKSSVILVPSWDNYEMLDKNVMNYHDYNRIRYFWTTVKGLDNTSYYPYYYLVDGAISVGDPYANLVLDGYSDKWLSNEAWPDRPAYPYTKFNNIALAVYKGDMNQYDFSEFTIPDHKNLIIYEMLFRDFTGTDNTDDGTIRKAMDRIPYLINLGVNCVELLPVMEFNGNNSWGYNTNFYMALDKAYGSPDDLKEFVETCHRNGIAVVLDIVFNQSDGLHPWYMMYPIDSNPFYNATAPHEYSVLNDWNQENSLVQQQWEDAIRYWMTAYNVDGFRFDLVKGLGNNDSYKSGTDSYNASRVARMKRLNEVIKSVKPNGIHINENLAEPQEENEMAEDGQLNWVKVSDSSYNFAKGSTNTDNTLDYFLAEGYNRTAYSAVSYIESHDEQRVGYEAVTFGNQAVKNRLNFRMRRLGSLAATMLMTPGAKMIWQFGELGCEENTKNGNNNNTDPKKVAWNLLDDPYRKALHDNYAELCNIRRNNPEIFASDATEFTRQGFTQSFTSMRTMKLKNGSREIVTLINPGLSASKSISVAVSNINSSNFQILSKSEGIAESALPTFSNNSVSFTVPANSYIVIGTRDVAAVEDITDGITNRPQVIGGNGEIIINGDYTSLHIYSLDGRQLNSLNQPAGIYIVEIDGTTTKVAVR